MSAATGEAPAETKVDGVQAGALLRPVWTRWRFWLAVLVALVLAAVVVGLLAQAPGRALDPASTKPDGSHALARLLAGYGTDVRTTTNPAARGGVTLVTEPDAFSGRQLRRLAAGSGRLVLVQPGVQATRAVVPGLEPAAGGTVDPEPDCAEPGALAAGEVDMPPDTARYVVSRGRHPDAVRCYGGGVAVAGRVVVIGSARLLENRDLDHRGVAALAANLVTADRSARTVRWLSPGASAAGTGQVSVWTLFPPGARRVALWLIVVGLLVVLWRARRLGPAVRERLPVVVRSAEIVEGHARLYERAGARDRAAAALRAATVARLTARLAVHRGTSAAQLAAVVAARDDRPAAEVWTVLAGPPPGDDLELARLAAALEDLERSTLHRTDGESAR